jgi:enoyl-CoA hydratase
MNDSLIETEDFGNWARLTICRADKHNALSFELAEAMTGRLNALADRPDVRAVVIRGEGERMFCAGFDITALPEAARAPEGQRFSRLHPIEDLFRAIMAFPFPVIAHLNGSAFGAGCELALCCDIRVAAGDIRMGMPPVRLGLVYPWWGLKRIVDILGLAAAQQLFLTGRPVSGGRLVNMGLVHFLVEPVELGDFVAELAGDIACHAPLALQGTKVVLNMLRGQGGLDGTEAGEAERIAERALGSRDLAEARHAFVEKRPPRFKGR